jgi:hypothetical protein
MRKVRLKVDDLAVEGFSIGGDDGARGTVKARSDTDWNCATRMGAWTCDGYFTCDRWMECPGTWVDNTCPGVNNC